MKSIYLDFNATTPVAPSVVEAMQPYFGLHYGNPSSHHPIGRAADNAVDQARHQVAHLLGADPDEIVFTSGGSESSNLAIKGVFQTPEVAATNRPHLLVSEIEHPATSEPAAFLADRGVTVTHCGCDRHGWIDPAEVESMLTEKTRLVSIMLANNETGVIQPIEDIAKLCRRRGILVHTDAAQVVGKIPLNVDQLGVDLVTLAGHKFYAPKGVGALYVRRGTHLESLIHGAGHEFGFRAGTENVPYIMAIGKAAELSARRDEEHTEHLEQLRERLAHRLRESIPEELTVNGELAERLPNTLSMNFPRVSAYKLLSRIPDVCASTGAACHSGSSSLSATLAAMQVTEEVARGTIRFSIGWPTSGEEIDLAAEKVAESWHALAT